MELVGDWSRRIEPPSFAREDAYNIRIGGEFVAQDLACLQLLPKTRKLSIFNYRIRDFSGIHAIPKLEVLWFIQRFHRSRLNLDFSQLANLKRLRVEWDSSVSNQGDLKRLTHLRIAGCSGVKHLDLTGLRSLVALDIGPAMGVEKVSLHGIPRLKRLTLALMSSLRHLEGDQFYETVTYLGIPGTKKLPRSILASFRKLKSVDVGTHGAFAKADFPNCRPAVCGLPV